MAMLRFHILLIMKIEKRLFEELILSIGHAHRTTQILINSS